MNLDEAVKDRKAAKQSETALLFFDGELTQDHDDQYVRLYADPRRRYTYLLFKKESIQKEVHKWTQEELAATGYAGFPRWRIGVAHGSEVQVVEIRVGKVGQLIGSMVAVKEGTRSCHSNVSGCSPACCSDASSGSGNCYCDYCCVGREAK